MKRRQVSRVAEERPPRPTSDDHVSVQLAPVVVRQNACAEVADMRGRVRALDLDAAILADQRVRRPTVEAACVKNKADLSDRRACVLQLERAARFGFELHAVLHLGCDHVADQPFLGRAD